MIAPFSEGWTGAQLMDVEPDRAEALKVEKGTGILVKRIFNDKTSTAALGGPERPAGPLMLQGDHGPVAFRNVRIKLLKAP